MKGLDLPCLAWVASMKDLALLALVGSIVQLSKSTLSQDQSRHLESEQAFRRNSQVCAHIYDQLRRSPVLTN